MRWLVKLFRGLVLALVVAVIGVIIWLYLVPPELLRVGTGYAAKIVCSNVFIAGRDPAEVLADDVQAPGHPLLRLVGADVDRDGRKVTAHFLKTLVPSTAIYRPGLGCANVPDGDIETAAAVSAPEVNIAALPPGEWPQGNDVGAPEARLASVLADPALTGSGMRAVVVVKDGRIVGEAYGEGFDASSPLLGWSMTKTVNAALIGRLMLENRIALADKGLFPEWLQDERREITLAQLLAMESGLAFNEDYGAVADVTRMLYLEPDMAGFAASLPLEAPVGTKFRYSSGTAVLLSKIWMAKFPDMQVALTYPHQALFAPLGMTSAVMEADAHGTLVGSSYLYATARDWARFGQFILQDGVWNGERLLPEGFAATMQEPTSVSGGRYTKMQAWHWGADNEAAGTFGLPDDVTYLQGHDGQSVALIPSQGLVVVRLGLTPSWNGYRPQRLAAGIIEALK